MARFDYDIFISYSTENKTQAEVIFKRIEDKGYKCFYAPRDIQYGREYAVELIRGISSSRIVLLIFSSYSDKSGYVLREINSAVARNKTIVTLKIEDFEMSEAMEFYLGPTQWVIGYPEVEERDIDEVCSICEELKIKELQEEININKQYVLPGVNVCKLSEVNKKLNKSLKDICIREVELDYQCIPTDKFVMNDAVEGLVEDWQSCTDNFEEDTSCLLIEDDYIIGYCDFYPVTNEGYEILITGKEIIRESMIDFYALGGEFNAYIAMIAVDPEVANVKLYVELFKWLYYKINEWKENDIIINNFGISVYSPIVDKFVQKLGFDYKCLNPACGKVYEISTIKFIDGMSKLIK